MSRKSVKHPAKHNLTLDYGLDHALGWFYTIFDSDKDDEEVIEEKDTTFDNLSKGQLAEKMIEFNAPKEHIRRVLLDLDIE